jgi:hypothetical protein
VGHEQAAQAQAGVVVLCPAWPEDLREGGKEGFRERKGGEGEIRDGRTELYYKLTVATRRHTDWSESAGIESEQSLDLLFLAESKDLIGIVVERSELGPSESCEG